mmetsp:Transcript_16542/g.23228  ORF Transcript_16542/g.23228 Transcript_16542/m.23228 type:complete len:581 (-) Transcript_16542:228-1970(-)|eukprot:CAMPEP_0175102738 /NCGR_PEP_ID=MMETSP0086_2-20121207/8636_1 /TAXON_ID=136419 /ORGANISM="Unknown Unknown, Strain D1" /LENGTH=580 /DNA_ID=CAMNT_0016377647 /DNA_START=28 /DNA_END=1770 /DNA_ORIENTATION=-
MKFVPAVLFAFTIVAAEHVFVDTSSPEMFKNWLSSHSLLGAESQLLDYAQLEESSSSVSELLGHQRRALIGGIKSWASAHLHGIEDAVKALHDKEEYPYFHWIPPYVTSIKAGTKAAPQTTTWESKCFGNITAVAATLDENTVTFEITTGTPTHSGCSDFVLLGSVAAFTLKDFYKAETQKFTWKMDKMTAAEKWDVTYNGIRVYRFPDNRLKTLSDLLKTANLFVSELTKGVPDEVAKANIDFLEKYTHFTMNERKTQTVTINETEVHSGDFFGVIRLDGLDPMLAWAMGAVTGHTTTALRIDGELYVVESTTKDSYWPTNGIQKTPWKQWLAQAKAAGYNLVHAPLSAEMRAKFNETAAIEMFKEMEGVDYGYFNMLWGWVDTLKDNYPCVAPDYTNCLEWEHIPVLLGNVGRLISAANTLIAPAFAQRLNLPLDTELAASLQTAAARNIDPRSIPSMVEQDHWVYNTTRNGKPAMAKSMVCCVFVCNVWKAGGLFADLDNEVNCAEQTNWDDYTLALFDKDAKRPAQCQEADPDNQLCQLEGKYTVNLNDYNQKVPYQHMAEKCPTKGPDYKKPDNC